MAEKAPSDDRPAVPVRVVRTVTPPYGSRSDEEMNLIGYLLFAGLLILLIPLGPIILFLWVLAKLRTGFRRRTED